MSRKVTFPADFSFGAATAAFQIEGANTAAGRGPSIWDAMCEKPGTILDGSDGSVACDHFGHMEQDVALMSELNLDTYRFSTAWPRMFPDGKTLNKDGIEFYQRLVDAMLAAGIRPWLTLYHWDLPQALQQTGGWVNRDTALRFADYAEYMVNQLGDRVDVITTLNEPWCSAFLGYAAGEHAPGIQDPSQAVSAAHHLLLAHGLGVQAMRAAQTRPHQYGITLNHTVAHPANPESEADRDAARKIDGAMNRIFLDPIFRGHYPSDVLADMAAAGLGEAAQDGDLAIINEPIDVLGVNFYNGAALAAPPENYQPWQPKNPAGNPISSPWVGAEDVQWVSRNLPTTAMGWEVNAEDLTLLLTRLQREYTGPAGIPMVITENGAAYHDEVAADGSIPDPERLNYLKTHIAAVADARAQGADVRGYLVWSLLDNFEWAWGYTRRFGIVRVDYETLCRTPKQSARWYAKLAETHSFELE